MTRGDDQSRSEHYCGIADNLRQLARQTRFPDVRQELFDLAEGFEHMAEVADKGDTAQRQS